MTLETGEGLQWVVAFPSFEVREGWMFKLRSFISEEDVVDGDSTRGMSLSLLPTMKGIREGFDTENEKAW